MPTYEALQRFFDDWADLTDEQRERFRRARRHFVEDLKSGGRFRAGLRVTRVQGTADVWEMTWDGDGRGISRDMKPG